MGFRLGSYEEGNFDIVSAMSCHHIADRMKELVEVWLWLWEEQWVWLQAMFCNADV